MGLNESPGSEESMEDPNNGPYLPGQVRSLTCDVITQRRHAKYAVGRLIPFLRIRLNEMGCKITTQDLIWGHDLFRGNPRSKSEVI